MVEATTTQTSLFDELSSWENLYRAARKTRLGKRSSVDCARFELERERELMRLQDELRTVLRSLEISAELEERALEQQREQDP